MKRFSSLFILILALVMVCSSASAATRNVGSSYCQVKNQYPEYIYSSKSTSSTKIKNVAGLYVNIDFLAGSAYWANASYETSSNSWSGYIPLSSLDIEFILMRNLFFTTYTLKSGDEGTGVKWLQAFLRETGHYSGSINGVYNTSTKNAVTAFQYDHSNVLDVDGLAGNATKTLLLFEAGIGTFANDYDDHIPNGYNPF